MKIIHLNSISLIIEEEILTYTGRELEPLWAFERYNIQRDSIVAFRGKIEVPLENMKDLKDVKEEGSKSNRLITSFGEGDEDTTSGQHLGDSGREEDEIYREGAGAPLGL